jgi:hypothetical protein
VIRSESKPIRKNITDVLYNKKLVACIGKLLALGRL